MSGEEVDALLPPTFMSRPVTWGLAVADDEECEAVPLEFIPENGGGAGIRFRERKGA